MKIIALVLALLLIAPVSALEIEPYYPYYQPQPVSQTQQFYTVVFDDEGEAAIAAKFSIYNKDKSPTGSLTLQIPGNVRIINVLQEAKSLTNQCVEYKSVCTAGTERVCTQYFPDGTCKVYETIHNPCLRQEQQCARYQQTYSYPYTYHPVEFKQNGNLFTFDLPVKTPASESTNLLLYYKVNGHAKRNAGIWYANFETAQIPQDTDVVRVSLNVIPDLHLKGGQTSTDYLPNFAIAETKMFAAMESAELSDFSRRIESSPGYIKQTQALDPWESFHVEAEYSSSTFLLYKARILGISLAVLVLFALSILCIRKIKAPSNTYARSVVSGFISSFAIYALLFTTFWLLDNLSRWIGYNYAELMGLLIILFVGITTLALFFAPSIYHGLKGGVGAGMLTFGATLIGLLILGIVIIILMSVLRTQVMF
jgi:hypothetical protein